jgi:hypothetical protein
MGRSQVTEAPDKRSQTGYNELYYYWANTIIIIFYSMGIPSGVKYILLSLGPYH